LNFIKPAFSVCIILDTQPALTLVKCKVLVSHRSEMQVLEMELEGILLSCA
jgi:hypothetical protein